MSFIIKLILDAYNSGKLDFLEAIAIKDLCAKKLTNHNQLFS